ncbi:MAG TPA: response regulator transcription factor [Candidatus Dojkabacteria bacterium]|nr:response regulator transcription factor [Candidatus Dojkabacteria bacterium]
MKILIVEDEDAIREVEKTYLLRAGYDCVTAVNGKSALDKFYKQKFDLVLLDINLPIIDGIEVCRRIRNNSRVPVIMVTARVEEMDEIIGLEIGADDYIKKPFSPNILVARINTHLRNAKKVFLKFNGFVIDPEKMLVKKNKKDIELTTTQFNIFYTLTSNPGKVFTRDEILNQAYDEAIPPDILDRTVDAHIKSIRRAIENDSANPVYILTVIGKGYKFNDR